MSLPRYFGAAWIVITVASVAILNAWAGVDSVPENTISAWATLWGEHTNAVPLFYGIVGGHWASRRWTSRHVPGGPVWVVLLLCVVGAIDYVTRGLAAGHPLSFLFSMLIGIPVGALIWPMHDEDVG